MRIIVNLSLTFYLVTVNINPFVILLLGTKKKTLLLEANSDKNSIVSFRENVQEESVQSQVNLVDLPRASDPCQVQNKIIICGINVFEGVNGGPDTSFYHATF